MMTTCIASRSPPCQNAPSTLALFECTISNAQMLVESMELIDLISAQKIVCQLHNHLIESMEPSASRLTQLAQRCSTLNEPKPMTTAATDESLLAHRTQSESLLATTGVIVKDETTEAPCSGLDHGNEPVLADHNGEISDCGLDGNDMLWSEDASESLVNFGQSHPSQLLLTESESASSATKVQRPLVPASSSGTSASQGSGGGGALSDRWKQLLRRAYRSLKDQSGELFDFTKSYSAPVNLKAAQTIISRAVSMTSQPPADVEAWKNSIPVETFMRYWFKDILRRNYRRQHQPRQGWASRVAKKLSQRQRSFDNLEAHGAVSQSDRPKLRTLLDLQYTSSDDEIPSEDAGAVGSTVLRVKRLAWESGELTRLKALLDGHFARLIANQKERDELGRIRRHPAWISQRPPPDGAPAWAVNSCTNQN